MLKRGLFGLLLVIASLSASAQVVLPGQIEDPSARQKQQQYMSKLNSLAAAATDHKFPYSFYFGRALDIEQDKAQRGDQRGIRFDRFDNRLVLAITGNYYVSYSRTRSILKSWRAPYARRGRASSSAGCGHPAC